ncbi:putative integral membrane protein (putative) [Lactiplantibacillus plantarum]|nr:putative integral membrane protein (putative) [Lactiplantibacillus plantarum]
MVYFGLVALLIVITPLHHYTITPLRARKSSSILVRGAHAASVAER